MFLCKDFPASPWCVGEETLWRGRVCGCGECVSVGSCVLVVGKGDEGFGSVGVLEGSGAFDVETASGIVSSGIFSSDGFGDPGTDL